MQTVPVSVIVIRLKDGWKAHIRYSDRFKDQEIACSARYLLDRKIDYLFRDAGSTW